MKMTTLTLALLGTTLALPAVAQSSGGPGDRMPSFEVLDADGDGKVTEAELEAFRASRFAEIDTDGDGTVTRDEFVARSVAQAEERADRMFERLDADGDGALSRDALEARRGGRGPDPARMISRLDSDGDGAVSQEEFNAARERIAERLEGRGHGKRFKHRN